MLFASDIAKARATMFLSVLQRFCLSREQPKEWYGFADINEWTKRPMATILIVDNDRDSRQAMAHVLECEGHIVIEKEAGSEALAAAHTLDPDLVITECRMTDVQVKEAAAACGVLRILSKPSSLEMLVTEVASALSTPSLSSSDAAVSRRPPAETYLASLENDVAAIGRALAADDLATVQRAGYKLKDTGSEYGFGSVTEIGDRLEAAAKADDRLGIAEQLRALARYLREACPGEASLGEASPGEVEKGVVVHADSIQSRQRQ